MKITAFFLPKNLDVEAIRTAYRAEYAEKLLFFISCIHFCKVTRGDLAFDAFIGLKAEILGKFIRLGDVKKVKEELLKRGIIETDNQYLVGKKCIGYRLTDQYRSEKVCRVPALYPKEQDISLAQLQDMEQYIKTNLERVTIEPEALEILDADSKKSVGAYTYGFISYHFIRDKNWFFATDPKTGRVFHNVANLNKELRPFLRLDGHKLIEVDISNCQPMLLYSFYDDKKSAEAIRYKAIVESGKFYEVIQAVTTQERQTTKKRFMSFAFGEPHHKNKVSKAFNILFPELGKIINSIKADDYTALAIALQKLEADLVIKAVVPLCKKMAIPVLTVHDSILTFPEHREIVSKLIKQQCEALYGLTPMLKTH